jgi:hypothetical protein
MERCARGVLTHPVADDPDTGAMAGVYCPGHEQGRSIMPSIRRASSRKKLCRSLLAVGMFLFPLVISGTTIVVIKTKSGVVVAADSALSRSGAVADHVCKMVVTDEFVFAASGSYYPDHGLDIFEMARQASRVSGNLSDKTGAYIAHVLPALEKFLEWDRTTQPENYAHLRQIGASEVVFVDRHSLEVIHLWFPMDPSGIPHAQKLDDWDQPVVADGFRLQPIGQAAEIYKAVKENPGWYRRPEESAARFLQLETTAKPLEVGPPFSIVRVDSTGVHWVDKGACS